MFTCIPYTIAWLLTGFASNVWMIYGTRLLIGCSHAFLTTSIYAVEVSSKSLRGTLSLIEEVCRLES